MSYAIRNLALVLAVLGPSAAPAQDDLTRPPRLDAPADTPAAGERPGAARLAEPPRREQGPVEEIIVVGEQRWRLPDLGSELRRRQEEQHAANARIRIEFFRVYDPDDQTRWEDPFPINSDLRRTGFIEVFRLRFGGRR